jgi:glutathione S-transferase
MWCIGELGIAHERSDWGGEFGGNDDPEYRRKNPNGRLPTLEEEDGWTLWESGAVVRYLCMKHSLGNLCPDTPRGRAGAEKWMDWSSLNFAQFNSVYLQHYFGPENKRSHDAILAAAKAQVQWLDILERHLAGRLAHASVVQLDAESGAARASQRARVVRPAGGTPGLSGACNKGQREANRGDCSTRLSDIPAALAHGRTERVTPASRNSVCSRKAANHNAPRPFHQGEFTWQFVSFH